MASNNNSAEQPAEQQCVHNFENRLAANRRPVASEVQDFMLKMSFAFPTTDVLVPAPMAVSILGQLTIVAASTDFKLVKPQDGFKHVSFPDSFRATITQLVDSGVQALNDSYANFDEMNKRCGTVRSLVNEIMQLLSGHKSNTSEQNDMAIQRHLPLHIESLQSSIKVCLDKAKSTHNAFHDLLSLTMEVHASCVATQGVNAMELHKAKLHKSSMEKNEQATREMKRIGEEALQRARQECEAAHKMFSDTVAGKHHAPPSSRVDALANTLVLGLHHCMSRRSSAPPPTKKESAPALSKSPSGSSLSSSSISDLIDDGYEQASALRTYAEELHALLTDESDGHLDWGLIKSQEPGGCLDVGVKCDEVISSLTDTDDDRNTSDATKTAIKLAKRGKELATSAGDILPPGNPATIKELTNNITTWRDEVLKFASTADLKLNTPLLSPPSSFLPPPPTNRSIFRRQKAKYAMEVAQYRLQVTQAQLDASRASSKAASDKLMEVNRRLGKIMSQLAMIDVQKQNWEEITSTLLKAIGFLSELKTYLNSLVHFFVSVDNFVSVSFKDAAHQFINIVVNSSSGIENTPSGPKMKKINGVITLDAWSRETIYKHALSTAKLTQVVQRISGMYVNLYNSQVHPGVNMLLGMGRLVGAQDPMEIAAAGLQIKRWADGASSQIVELITTQMRETQEEIEKRMGELEKSFGEILPQHGKLEEIVGTAKAEKVEEAKSKIDAVADANGVYGSEVDLTY